jgi:hypothetical protein
MPAAEPVGGVGKAPVEKAALAAGAILGKMGRRMGPAVAEMPA